MKIISSEEFTLAVNNTDEATRLIIYSTQLYDCAEKILSTNTSAVDPSDTLLPLGYMLLKLQTIDEAAAELKTLGVSDSLKFIADVKECIEAKKTSAVQTSITETEATVPAQDLASEIEEAEAAIQAIPKVKTMAQDAQAANMYSSSQETLLKDRQPKEPS